MMHEDRKDGENSADYLRVRGLRDHLVVRD